ncbi:MAG: N-acetylmuramoyl-L-alanine amidase [Clostridia bacterium]|jgi:N-acetylmuramoyl-L-alanine amidase|nr:N-acetylmuramoyl-L-alanine amidase [Clostridia bacterium]MBT7122708.1 N-acetylmuramoyl-L-alanine amidase [Clostridia bacterium]
MKRFRKSKSKSFVLAFILAIIFAFSGCISATPSESSNADSPTNTTNQTDENRQTDSLATPKITAPPSQTSASPEPIVTPEIEAVEETSDPALPLTGIVIGIDPGHQDDPNEEKELISPTGTAMKIKVSEGTFGRFTGIFEYVINLQVGMKLKSRLESLGATVIMTRETSDIDISNAERAVLMNDIPVDCWIRIHANGNDNSDVNGLFFLAPSAGTMNTTDPSVQSNSLLLAQTLLPATIDATGAKDRGVILRGDQTGFSWSSVPVCTIEMGYMTNEVEDNLLVTSEYQDKIVDGLTAGFLEYFNQDQNE